MTTPLRKTLTVRCSVEHAFDTFVRKMDLWWPAGHRPTNTRTLALENGIGGRFVAHLEDGSEKVLGEVVHWEPPASLGYTWRPGSTMGVTRVDIRFVADGDATLVEVLHTANTAEEEWPQKVALYDKAWSTVLPALGEHIHSS